MGDEQAPLSRPWIIVGAGRLGRMMGLVARDLGVELVATWNRDEQGARATAALLDILPERALCGGLRHLEPVLRAHPTAIVWLTVVDDLIESVAATLSGVIPSTALALHTAGSLSSKRLKQAGIVAPVASLHPLLAVADPTLARAAMTSCVWTLEGDEEAVEELAELMGRLEIRPMRLASEAKIVYHAAAVTAANLLVSLMDSAYEMAEAAGLTREQAQQMLLPLASSSLENLWRKSPGEALTGPVARGDAATIARHEEALGAIDEELLEIYRVLTRRAWSLLS